MTAEAKSEQGSARLPRKPKRKFYIIESGWAVFPYDCINYLAFNGTHLFAWPKEGRGFDRYPERPTFLLERKDQRDFWQYIFYWFVNERMKAFLERYDPAAFEFLECETKLPDGTNGPAHWLCDVVRVRDALVEAESPGATVGTDTMGQKYYVLGGHGDALIINEDAVGPHHVFHLKYSQNCAMCNEDFKSAFKGAGLKGMTFYSWQDVERRHKAAKAHFLKLRQKQE